MFIGSGVEEGNLGLAGFGMSIGNGNRISWKKRNASDGDSFSRERKGPFFWMEVSFILIMKSLRSIRTGEPAVKGGKNGQRCESKSAVESVFGERSGLEKFELVDERSGKQKTENFGESGERVRIV